MADTLTPRRRLAAIMFTDMVGYSALYLVGTFLVTVAFNVPLNNSLAAVAPADRNAASLWARYFASWTAWNHVRTAVSFAAVTSLTIALCC